MLPVTVCTGPSWAQTRSLIANDYVLDMVISSHDPQRWNFSDSTDLSEALLIATRRPEKRDQKQFRTTFVNLWQNPDGVVDADRLAQAVSTTDPADVEGNGTALLERDGEHVGEVFSIPESTLNNKQWVGVQFARVDLVRSALKLLNEGKLSVPGGDKIAGISMCRLDEIGKVGPDRSGVAKSFDETQTITAYPMVKGHETDERKSMSCEPNMFLSPLPHPKGGQRRSYGERLWEQSGSLLIGESLRLDTARVIAMRSSTDVLSNVWWPVKMASELHEQLLTVWLNSSVGMLATLSHRTTTEGSWIALKKTDLKGVPVLDPRRLTEHQLVELSDLYDRLACAEFERFPDMVDCPTRTALDEGVADILRLPDLRNLRVLLASEPVICNRRL